MKHSFPYQALRRDDFGVLKPSRLRSHGILPIDPGAHGIGRLSVAEMLEELEDRDQGQAPRGQGGLALAGVKRTEILILPEPRVSHGFKDGDWIISTSLPRGLGR